LKFNLHTLASLLWTGKFPVEIKKEVKKSTVNNVANVFQKSGAEEKVKGIYARSDLFLFLLFFFLIC
jgi:hypothetical protein